MDVIELANRDNLRYSDMQEAGASVDFCSKSLTTLEFQRLCRSWCTINEATVRKVLYVLRPGEKHIVDGNAHSRTCTIKTAVLG